MAHIQRLQIPRSDVTQQRASSSQSGLGSPAQRSVEECASYVNQHILFIITAQDNQAAEPGVCWSRSRMLRIQRVEADWDLSGNQSLTTNYYPRSLQLLIRKKIDCACTPAPMPEELSDEVRQSPVRLLYIQITGTLSNK